MAEQNKKSTFRAFASRANKKELVKKNGEKCVDLDFVKTCLTYTLDVVKTGKYK